MVLKLNIPVVVVVPYEVTVHTGDVKDAGTDAQIFLKLFGAGGSSSDVTLDKQSERFERGRTDLIKVESSSLVPQFYTINIRQLHRTARKGFILITPLCGLSAHYIS